VALNNIIQTIIRKSNGDITNFYVQDSSLFYRNFISNKGWDLPNELIPNTSHNQLDIKIDEQDKIYGIVHTQNGNVMYLHTKKSNILYEKLFEYNTDKYILKYPFILKLNSNIHIFYYLQNLKKRKFWGIMHHFFDGNKWIANKVTVISSYPIINPFQITYNSSYMYIFYLHISDNKEEIFLSKFNVQNKSWNEPIQITETKNNKLYLNVLDSKNKYHISWCENIDDNYIVQYTNIDYDKDISAPSNITPLSEPSNCTLPTFIQAGKALWSIWVQMNKLYNCYSLDNGNIWSNPEADEKSIGSKFIRYKFSSNCPNDIKDFKLNNSFGTYYPRISFLGFKNIKS
jgi:hypothetical protein